MEWDSKLDEMFAKMDEMLHPMHRVDQDVLYELFKTIRDIMKELAGHNDTSA